MTTTQPVNAILRSILRVMYGGYLPHQNPRAMCLVTHAYDPAGWNNKEVCGPGSDDYWQEQGPSIAEGYIDQLPSMLAACTLLNFIGLNDSFLQSCPYDALRLTDEQYIYLWNLPDNPLAPNQPFCRVRTYDGTVYYSSITNIKHISDSPEIGELALSNIANSFLSNIAFIDGNNMTLACSSSLSYSDMVNNSSLQNICGCYVGLPPRGVEFSSDERLFLEQNPQCLPSCLSSTVKFVKQGGRPISCQQNICIVDNVNIVGEKTTITQICPYCVQPFECVCYIHVNGKSIQNKACNTTYQVDPTGKITATSTNSPQTSQQFFSKLKDILISSHAILFIILGVGLVVLIVIAAILISDHLKRKTTNHTKVKKYASFSS